MTTYQQIIIEATGCREEDVQEIEDLMRQVVFHSTLDWQTRDQLEAGAREAWSLLQEIREADSTGIYY